MTKTSLLQSLNVPLAAVTKQKKRVSKASTALFDLFDMAAPVKQTKGGKEVKELKTPDDFKKELENAGSKLVVVDFYADWCGPCKMIAPKIKILAEQFAEVVFLKVNVDENEETAQEYEISAMPTFKFFRNGAELKESMVMGANETKIKEMIEKNK